MAKPVAHVIAQELILEGRYRRQRCAWCGEALLDEDLSLIMVQEGQELPPAFESGTWLEVEPGFMQIVTPEDGKFPKNSCMAIEFPAKPPRLEVVQGGKLGD